jgi:Glycosyl transferase family group 2
MPLYISCNILYGYFRAKLLFRTTYKIQKMIIQITTTGNRNLVNMNISSIRSYNLSIPYEIWVVTESSYVEGYIAADKIIRVPSNFRSIAKYKARALDYSSQLRRHLGITSENVKILFLDDDVIPSKRYIEKCFVANYDIVEGIIQPKLNYGTRYSYVENMRTLACMSVCSVYQSHGHPVWVHGEGLCVRASSEQKVGWQFDVIASEDLVFGHTAATKKVKWGFIWEAVYITSPWTFKDYFKQRKRWIWGNAHAIARLLTWKSKIRMLWFYTVGGSSLWLSIIGLIMDQLGMLHFNVSERTTFLLSVTVWLGLYGYIGFTVGNRRFKHVILSILLVYYTSFMNSFPIWIGLFLSKPQKFEVIAKERTSQGITKENIQKYLKKSAYKYRSVILLAVPILLSTFTHLWNASGFPDVLYDEGVYMHRALHILEGNGPNEVINGKNPFYDHPYFGQLFLAGIFKMIDYPQSVHPSDDIHSFEMLYVVPRILMGLLAVIDTFLIYKIAEHRYDKRVAFVASILFAVMPMSWLLRRILLESIQLPFLLSSILFAIYYPYTKNTLRNTDNTNTYHRKKNILIIVLSGIFLGTAIFTKIPAFTMIPLVAFLVYTSSNRSWKILCLWFIPVIFIPAIWPGYAVAVGEFNYWLNSIFYQTHRPAEGQNFLAAIEQVFQMGPFLTIIGLAGIIYSYIKKVNFLALWSIPYLIFLYFLGYVSPYSVILLIPVLCIGTATLLIDVLKKIMRKKIVASITQYGVISAIMIFGFISTLLLITSSNISSQFQAMAFVTTYTKYLKNNNNGIEQITIASSPVYSWVFSYVFHIPHVLSGYRDLLFHPISGGRLLLIVDPHFKAEMKSNKDLQLIYRNTDTLLSVQGGLLDFDTRKYPYTSLATNTDGSIIEIRISR